MKNDKAQALHQSGRLEPQRLIGLGVMVAVLLVTVVVGATRGRVIPGEAVAGPVDAAHRNSVGCSV